MLHWIRWILGLAAIAAAVRWTWRAWRSPAAVYDEEFGLRITPLAPDERRDALAREAGAGDVVRL